MMGELVFKHQRSSGGVPPVYRWMIRLLPVNRSTDQDIQLCEASGCVFPVAENCVYINRKETTRSVSIAGPYLNTGTSFGEM